MPSVWAPSTSSGYGSVWSAYAAACSESRPTCGPLPCPITSWFSAAIGASASAAMRTLRRCASAVIGSPRRSNALPPSATTIRMSVSQRRDEDRLDGVHAILRLLECDVVGRLEDLVGDFDAACHAERLGELLAERGLRVVKRRQAVHELHLRIARRL